MVFVRPQFKTFVLSQPITSQTNYLKRRPLRIWVGRGLTHNQEELKI